MRHSIINFTLLTALIAVLTLTACETFEALSKAEKPRTYKETIFVLEEDINAARDVTALLARNGTINRTQAAIIGSKTKEMLSYIDTIWVSIGLGDISQCRLIYEGVELPCNTASDKMLFILLKIQGELERAEQ